MKWLEEIACRVGLIGIALILVSGLAHAQTFRGTILGTIMDSSGAAIPGAKVVIKNQGTAQTRTTTSGDAGTYTVPELPIGQYAVTVSKEGFESMTVGGVEVTVAGEHRVDVTLQPGKIESRIEVEATAPMVATTEDTLGGTVRIEPGGQPSREWPRLHQADLPATRRERRSRPDHGFSRLVRRVLREWRARTFQ